MIAVVVLVVAWEETNKIEQATQPPSTPASPCAKSTEKVVKNKAEEPKQDEVKHQMCVDGVVCFGRQT
jgi:hypothetical protein